VRQEESKGVAALCRSLRTRSSAALTLSNIARAGNKIGAIENLGATQVCSA
jgi:hypothetical protein